MKQLLFFALFVQLLTSCGYRFSMPQETKKATTLDVPYAINDEKGIFTDQLIGILFSQTPFTYSSNHPEYILKATLCDVDDEKIGFRKDQDGTGKLLHNVIAVEGRKKAKVKVLIEDQNGKVIWGPHEFTADADYDYVDDNSLHDLSFINKNHERQSVLSFSLGQLESIDAAQDAAEWPLYKKLAQKIVDSLSATW